MTSKGSRGSSTRDVSSGQGDRLYLDVRLVVRRVRPTPGSQLALDVAFSYHAFITDRDGQLLDIDADHRRHAVVEQVERVTAEMSHPTVRMRSSTQPDQHGPPPNFNELRDNLHPRS